MSKPIAKCTQSLKRKTNRTNKQSKENLVQSKGEWIFCWRKNKTQNKNKNVEWPNIITESEAHIYTLKWAIAKK